MTQRINYAQQSPELFQKFSAFSAALGSSSIDATLRHLVEIRASQMNGCALCVDMHIKQATIHGERPLRLHHLAIWRESPLFSSREQAALEWTEALTHIPAHGVPDDLYERVRAELPEKALADADNFADAWSDPRFRDALWRTAAFAALHSATASLAAASAGAGVATLGANIARADLLRAIRRTLLRSSAARDLPGRRSKGAGRSGR